MASTNGKPPTDLARKPRLETRDFLIQGEVNAWPKARHRRRRTEWIAFLQEYKSETPCADCGQTYPYYVMEFDHTENHPPGRRSRARNSVAGLIRRNASDEAVAAEMDACDLVCANCHNTRTHMRRLLDG